MSGQPLLQAKEISTQVNLLRFLLKSKKQSDLFNTLEGDQIKLTLIRNENGEWDIPQFFTSQRSRNSAKDGKAFRRQISLTNLTISIKTGKGESTHFYKGME